RNFSCSHAGVGGPRVMRTTGQMGAAVGLAASLCKKYDVNPRTIYKGYLDEYLSLIESQKYQMIPLSKE
ncbi:MAG: FAD-dependent oxidoreductase, partial [Allomuricauda sp.]